MPGNFFGILKQLIIRDVFQEKCHVLLIKVHVVCCRVDSYSMTSGKQIRFIRVI